MSLSLCMYLSTQPCLFVTGVRVRGGEEGVNSIFRRISPPSYLIMFNFYKDLTLKGPTLFMDLDKLRQPTPDITNPVTIKHGRVSIYDIQYQAKVFRIKI